MKYRLTTGGATNKVELYIIDLFRLYLIINRRDIPMNNDLGFDFLIKNKRIN